jgi:hypothetical protein
LRFFKKKNTRNRELFSHEMSRVNNRERNESVIIDSWLLEKFLSAPCKKSCHYRHDIISRSCGGLLCWRQDWFGYRCQNDSLGEGLSVGVIFGVFVSDGVITGDSGSAVVGILDGSPRSMRMSLLAADRGLSTLMENVLVAVPEDVWKATTARPSASVVTRA